MEVLWDSCKPVYVPGKIKKQFQFCGGHVKLMQACLCDRIFYNAVFITVDVLWWWSPLYLCNPCMWQISSCKISRNYEIVHALELQIQPLHCMHIFELFSIYLPSSIAPFLILHILQNSHFYTFVSHCKLKRAWVGDYDTLLFQCKDYMYKYTAVYLTLQHVNIIMW